MTAQEFWQWFSDNTPKFEGIQSKEAEEVKRLINLFDEKLMAHHKGLSFELGLNADPETPENDYEVVISAEGNLDHFHKVIELVEAAPKINNWTVTAFKQPGHANIGYKGLELSPENLSFSPLAKQDDDQWLGLRITIPGYNEKQEDDYYYAMTLLLDALLGEFISATEVHYIDFIAASTSAPGEGHFPLTDLPNFLEWNRRENRKLDS